MKKLLLSISALALSCLQMNAQAPNLVFSNIYKGAGANNDYGTSLVTLPNDEIAMAGASGNVNPMPFYPQAATSTFLGKYNQAGVNIWYSSLGGNGNAAQLATDAVGNIYMVGSSLGTVAYFGSTSISSIGTNTLGSQNIIIAKYSNSGILQWAKAVGSSGNEYGTGIALDNNNDIYITGYVAGGTGTMDFEPGVSGAAFTSPGASFLVKLSNNGNHIWHKTITAGGYNYHTVCVDNNNVYFATSTSGTNINVNTSGPSYTITTNAATYDIVLMKYRLDGTLVNAKPIGGNTNNDYSRGIEVKNGKLVLFGSIAGTGINMNGYLATPTVSVSTNSGSKDGFIAVYDTNLVCQWAKPIGSYQTALDETWGGTFDNIGNVLVCGQYQGTGAQPCNFNIGSVGTFTAASNSTTTTDFFYASYNVLTGTCNWLYHDGLFTDNDNAADIAIDTSGKIWITGLSSGGTSSGNNLFLNKHFCAATYTISLKEDGINLTPTSANAFSANGCNAQTPVFTAIATPSTNVKYTFYNLNGAVVNGNSMTAITTNTNYSFYGGLLLVQDSVTKCEQLYSFNYSFVGNGTFSISPTNTVNCSGSPITLTGNFNTGITYTWTPGNIVAPASVNQQTFAPTSNTTYTALVNDGACLWKATATVSVNPLPTVIANSTSTLVCSGPGNTFSLTASGTATTFTWSSVNYGLIGYNSSYNQGALTTNTFVVAGSNGTCTAQSSIVVVVSPCTGIDEQTNTSGISIYPNPTNGLLFIDVANLLDNSAIELSDITGRIVVNQIMSSTKEQLNISDLTNGVYFLKIRNGNQQSISKIVKQ